MPKYVIYFVCRSAIYPKPYPQDSRHSRHTFETNVDYQDRPRFWNTEHRVRGYDSRRESIVAGGQVRTNDDEDKQIVCSYNILAALPTNLQRCI